VDLYSFDDGQRVRVRGVLVNDERLPPPVLEVAEVEPVAGPPDRTATLSFELTVEGEPPANTSFFGAVAAEGCRSAPLTDSDGVYTGSVDVPRFPPGTATPDAEPVSLPVQIVQADDGAGPCNPTRVIRDFGSVPIDGDKTFSASVSFGQAPPAGGGSGGLPSTGAPPLVLPVLFGAAAALLLLGGGLLAHRAYR